MEQPPPPTVQKSRVTISEHVYHQAAGEQPTQTEWVETFHLASDDDPFSRNRCKVGREWIPLETAWIKVTSLLCIRNNEQKDFKYSTQDESGNTIESVRIIEVRLVGAQSSLLIYPGTSLRLRPAVLEDVRIRCVNGPAEYFLIAYPE